MNNETQKSRFRFVSKAASLLLSATIMTSAFTGLGGTLLSTPVEAASSNSYGLLNDASEGLILHAWNWSFNAIKDNMQAIAEAGYTSVQTSPVQRPKDYSNTSTSQWDWWKVYQPTSLSFSPGGHPWFGSKDDFKAMCDEAEKYGIKVIVDIVANHMANTTGGYGNTRADICEQNEAEYRDDDSCWHLNGSKGINYGQQNRNGGTDSLTYGFGGWPDLNTGNKKVQNAIINLLKECYDLGADGFRFDAAKHIELPTDPGGASDFWPTVIGGIENYASSKGGTVYCYGEILDDSATDIKNYTQYIAVTDNRAGNNVRFGIRNGDIGKAANSALTYNGVPAKKIVMWAESHDTYANDDYTGDSTHDSQEQVNRAWAITASRQFAALYYIRPDNPRQQKMGQASTNTSWKSKEIAEVNKFHNYFVGQSEYISSSGDNVLVERGTEGIVIVNIRGNSQQISAKVNKMKDGTYKDQVTGNTFTVSGGQISGQLGSKGIAVVYNPSDTPKPVTGSVSASPATNTSFTDTLSVTLTATNATNTTYTTSEGASGSFTNGQKITVGASTAVGGKVTVTVKGTGSDNSPLSATYTYTKTDPNAAVNVYFDNSSYNWSSVYAYVYDESTGTVKEMAKWPGVKMTDKDSNGYYKLDVSGYETNGQVIFSDGTNSASNRYPADQMPGMKIGGSSKLFSANNKWTDYTPVNPHPIQDPTVTVDKASGTSFSTETLDITLSLVNATSGTYSVDNGPEKTFTSATKVTIGEGKIGDSAITVKATATDGTNTKSYTFTYDKKYVIKTTSSSAASANSKYATNPNGNIGARKTITSAGDFTSETLIAQGIANDDPAAFRGTHEAPKFDLYALYAAWDDTNIYVGIQYTNVIDVVDPAQEAPQTGRGKPNGADADIPQMLLFDTRTGDYTDGSTNSTVQPTVWNTNITFSGDTKVDKILMYSPKEGINNYSVFPVTNGLIDYDNAISPGYQKPLEGASVTWEDGFFCSTMEGIKANGYEGYKPSDLESSSGNWVDFLTTNHSKAQDTFCIITLPLKYLGVSASDIESNGIGLMAVATYGESGIGCLPHDTIMLDNALEPYTKDDSTSGEKSDADEITVPLASVGKGGTPVPPKPNQKTPLQVNFGTDRSAPQLSTTALTLKGIGYGGTAPYKYEFSVDGKVIQASGTTASVSWTPTTAGQHTIKCVITDSTGATATSSKTFTSEGGGSIIIVDDLVNNSTLSATTITLGNSITAKGAATGGTGTYQYQVVYKKTSAASWTTAKAYSSTATATITPATATTYDVCIKVKDSAGTEVKKFFTVTVNPNTTELKNNSTLSATTITLGSTVTAKGAASGGTSPYKYQVVYKKTSATTWTTAQAYSSTTSVSFKPAAATTYDVCIKVKDNNGTEVKKFFTLTVKASALVNNSTVSATTITKGNSFTAKGAATGGSGSYTYAYYYKQQSQSSWTEKKGFSSTTSVSITPATATTYDVCIKVKDSAGTIEKKYFTVTVKAALVNNSALSATSIKLGNTITAKGSATGGTGYYNFAVLYKRTSQSTWTTAQAYKSNTTVTFKPAAATTYDVCVKVKDSAGTEVKKYFTVKVTSATLTNTSTLSATSINLGSSITAKCSAAGGTGYYNFAVYYKRTSQTKWTTAQAYKSNTTVTFKPAAATTYDVCVKVKDSSGTEVKKYFTVKVTSATLTNTSTLSATSIKIGSPLTVKASATGGTAPYQYAVYYRQLSQSAWTEIQNFSSNATISIKPAKAVPYRVCVKVKDSTGTVEKKYFDLKMTA